MKKNKTEGKKYSSEFKISTMMDNYRVKNRYF